MNHVNGKRVARERALAHRSELLAKVQAGRTVHSPVRTLSREEIAALYPQAGQQKPAPPPTPVRVVAVEPVLVGPRAEPEPAEEFMPVEETPTSSKTSREAAVSLRRMGHTIAAISRSLGVETDVVREWCNECEPSSHPIETARALREELADIDRQRAEKRASALRVADELEQEARALREAAGAVAVKVAAPAPKPAALGDLPKPKAGTHRAKILAVWGDDDMLSLADLEARLPDLNADSLAYEARRMVRDGYLRRVAYGVYGRVP